LTTSYLLGAPFVHSKDFALRSAEATSESKPASFFFFVHNIDSSAFQTAELSGQFVFTSSAVSS
jgi:hypothetical protein